MASAQPHHPDDLVPAPGKVWVLIYDDERAVLTVSATADLAWAEAERDCDEQLAWHWSNRGFGRYLSDKHNYSVHPFTVDQPDTE